jgi:hypothetical protein
VAAAKIANIDKALEQCRVGRHMHQFTIVNRCQ